MPTPSGVTPPRASGFDLGAIVVGLLLLGITGLAEAQSAAPGGFLEKDTSGDIRPRLSAQQIQAFMPQRGVFTFPSPWLTEGVRLTNAGDCSGGGDCLNYVGYSYWRNINNHAGSDTMLIFLSLRGPGPTLFSYDKTNDQVTKVGPLFASSSRFYGASAEGWYFSGTQPTKIYLNDGPKLLRYDVLSWQLTTVFDASTRFGAGRYIWQMHSSDDDRVHSATLRDSSTSKMLGCLAYNEDTSQFSWFPEIGVFDECHVDKSGRYLIILDNVDRTYGLDNRIIDLQTGAETRLLDQNGALGHLDAGHGYMVGEDDWAPIPGGVRLWKFGQALTPGPTQGTIVYHTTDWSVSAGHFAHGDARPGAAPEQQVTCSSNASRSSLPRANEIVCYRNDSSGDVLVVAPVMTDLNAPGGGDDYSKSPKGNFDVTGGYFIWTSNLAGSRLDAFLVKVPSYRLIGGVPSDTTPPSVAVTSPAAGDTVTGSVSVTVSASDDVGVAGVRFLLDGANSGAEDTTSPYGTSLDLSSVAPGSHTITAVARDAAGNRTTSAPVSITVAAPPPLTIASVSTSVLKPSSVTITWTTSVAADSQVEYGTTTSYGTLTPLDMTATTTHSKSLTGLSGGTLYHFRVRSRDASGTLAVSADQTLTTVLDVDAGRVAHLKLDETSGTIASDDSGTGHPGYLMNGALWMAGKVSGGVLLDGIDDMVSIPYVSALDAFPLSLSLWAKTGDSGTKGLVSKYSPGIRNGYELLLRDGDLCATYSVNGLRHIGDGTRCSLRVVGPFNDDLWHHFALVVDASGARIYVDGVHAGSVGWVGSPGAPGNLREVRLGRFASTISPFLTGEIDEFRLYDRPLGDAEVASLAAVTSPPEAPTIPSPGPSILEPVTWTNVERCSVTGNTLEKTSGRDDTDDAGAISLQRILAGDGYVEFTVLEAAALRLAGLSNGSSGTGYAEIDFGIRLQSGVAEVRENGVYRAETPFAAGDTFRVAVESGTVRYYHGGAVFYTSRTAPSYPLILDTSLVNLNAEIANAMILHMQ